MIKRIKLLHNIKRPPITPYDNTLSVSDSMVKQSLQYINTFISSTVVFSDFLNVYTEDWKMIGAGIVLNNFEKAVKIFERTCQQFRHIN